MSELKKRTVNLCIYAIYMQGIQEEDIYPSHPYRESIC